MFNWKAEEQKLTNENHKEMVKSNYGAREVIVYDIENKLTVEEKKTILNEWTDGNINYFIKLNNKYMLDLENGIIKKDCYGYAKENSKKAWIRKHDTINLFWNGKSKDNMWTKDYYKESFFNYDKLYFGYFVTDNNINEIFHCLLTDLHNKEKTWFCEHDEYEILKTKWRECGCPSFGNSIGNCSNGSIYVFNEDEKRDITIEELKMLLRNYEKVQKLEEELSKNSKIIF